MEFRCPPPGFPCELAGHSHSHGYIPHWLLTEVVILLNSDTPLLTPACVVSVQLGVNRDIQLSLSHQLKIRMTTSTQRHTDTERHIDTIINRETQIFCEHNTLNRQVETKVGFILWQCKQLHIECHTCLFVQVCQLLSCYVAFLFSSHTFCVTHQECVKFMN